MASSMGNCKPHQLIIKQLKLKRGLPSPLPHPRFQRDCVTYMYIMYNYEADEFISRVPLDVSLNNYMYYNTFLQDNS